MHLHSRVRIVQSELKSGARTVLTPDSVTSPATSSATAASSVRKGTRVLSGSRDKSVRLWDTDTFECLLVIVSGRLLRWEGCLFGL